MGNDIVSSALDQASQLATVAVNQGPYAAVRTAGAKGGAALTDSEIPEAEPWDRDAANGVALKTVALKRGWERLAAGTYRDDQGHIWYEEDPADLAEAM